MSIKELADEIRTDLVIIETLRNKVYKSRNQEPKIKRKALEQLNNILAEGLILYDCLLTELNVKGVN